MASRAKAEARPTPCFAVRAGTDSDSGGSAGLQRSRKIANSKARTHAGAPAELHGVFIFRCTILRNCTFTRRARSLFAAVLVSSFVDRTFPDLGPSLARFVVQIFPLSVDWVRSCGLQRTACSMLSDRFQNFMTYCALRFFTIGFATTVPGISTFRRQQVLSPSPHVGSQNGLRQAAPGPPARCLLLSAIRPRVPTSRSGGGNGAHVSPIQQPVHIRGHRKCG